MSKAKFFRFALHVEEVVVRTLLETIDAFLELPNFPWSGKEVEHFNINISVNVSLYKYSSIVNLLIFKTQEYGPEEDETHS